MLKLKGLFTNFFLYRLNLIFWIVMGCGIADFDLVEMLDWPLPQYMTIFDHFKKSVTKGIPVT